MINFFFVLFQALSFEEGEWFSNHNKFLVIIRMSKDSVVYLCFLRLLENMLRFTIYIDVAKLIILKLLCFPLENRYYQTIYSICDSFINNHNSNVCMYKKPTIKKHFVLLFADLPIFIETSFDTMYVIKRCPTQLQFNEIISLM